MLPIDAKDINKVNKNVNFDCFYKTPLGELVRVELKEARIELKDDTKPILERHLEQLELLEEIQEYLHNLAHDLEEAVTVYIVEF